MALTRRHDVIPTSAPSAEPPQRNSELDPFFELAFSILSYSILRPWERPDRGVVLMIIISLQNHEDGQLRLFGNRLVVCCDPVALRDSVRPDA